MKLLRIFIILWLSVMLSGCGETKTQTVDKIFTKYSTVYISQINQAPTANAGPDKVVTIWDKVILDASNSYDPDGDMLSFKWTLVSQPAGSFTMLNSDLSPNADLTPDIPGDYILSLIAHDGRIFSDPATLKITAKVPTIVPIGSDPSGKVLVLSIIPYEIFRDNMRVQFGLKIKTSNTDNVIVNIKINYSGLDQYGNTLITSDFTTAINAGQINETWINPYYLLIPEFDHPIQWVVNSVTRY